jgi:hemin uptake protein HemP
MGATFVVTLREAFEASPASPRRTVSIRSAALFRNAQEVIIIHREQEYRLRVTRADKLILTK